MSDYLATTLIIETGRKAVTVNLKRPLSLPQVYQYFYQRTGKRCLCTLSKGTARVTF